MAEKKTSNPFLLRYTPFDRFSNGSGFSKQTEQPVKFFHTVGDSLTDKEAYKLSLASKRSSLASSLGSSRVGQYMFQDGKYDPLQDVSYIMRLDLTPQEIDRYIELTKQKLEKDTAELNDKAKAELDALEKLKADKVDKKDSSDSSSSVQAQTSTME